MEVLLWLAVLLAVEVILWLAAPYHHRMIDSRDTGLGKVWMTRCSKIATVAPTEVFKLSAADSR